MPARPWILAALVGLTSGASGDEAVAERVALLADKRISESSGLTRSQKHPGVFWTHNDSGGEPCLFAIDATGRTLAKLRVRDAANFDWEDLACGRDAEGRPVLFVGDIGDNFHLRPTLQIYQVPEPELPATADHEIDSAKPQVWHVAYPNERHNAESLFVEPATGRLHLLTKTESGDCTLFACPQPLTAGMAMVLEKVADLKLPPKPRTGKRPKDASQATAAAFSPDGQRLVIASYSYLYEWRLSPQRPLAETLAQPPEILVPPLLKQLEAVCYDADSRTLWMTSEQLPTPLFRLKRP